jgi:hypothetical protein
MNGLNQVRARLVERIAQRLADDPMVLSDVRGTEPRDESEGFHNVEGHESLPFKLKAAASRALTRLAAAQSDHFVLKGDSSTNGPSGRRNNRYMAFLKTPRQEGHV